MGRQVGWGEERDINGSGMSKGLSKRCLVHRCLAETEQTSGLNATATVGARLVETGEAAEGIPHFSVCPECNPHSASPPTAFPRAPENP